MNKRNFAIVVACVVIVVVAGISSNVYRRPTSSKKQMPLINTTATSQVAVSNETPTWRRIASTTDSGYSEIANAVYINGVVIAGADPGGTEDGVAPGEAQEMPNEGAAIRRAEAMSRDAANAGALAFKRSGDPNMGNFHDATILKSFGEIPANLDEL